MEGCARGEKMFLRPRMEESIPGRAGERVEPTEKGWMLELFIPPVSVFVLGSENNTKHTKYTLFYAQSNVLYQFGFLLNG